MEFIREPISEQNPSKQQLSKLKKLLKRKRNDLIDFETGKIGNCGYQISDLVRNQLIFEMVVAVLNFYPICSTLFEDRTDYFGTGYKNWILREYPEIVIKKCLNKSFVLRWAAKYFSLDYCTYLNSIDGYDCTKIMFEIFVKEKKF